MKVTRSLQKNLFMHKHLLFMYKHLLLFTNHEWLNLYVVHKLIVILELLCRSQNSLFVKKKLLVHSVNDASCPTDYFQSVLARPSLF